MMLDELTWGYLQNWLMEKNSSHLEPQTIIILKLGGGFISNIFYFYPQTLGKWSSLTNNIFGMGCFNHQLAKRKQPFAAETPNTSIFVPSNLEVFNLAGETSTKHAPNSFEFCGKRIFWVGLGWNAGVQHHRLTNLGLENFCWWFRNPADAPVEVGISGWLQWFR